MQTTRHRPTHDRRRRIWSVAFSDKAIRSHEKRIQVYQDRLMAQILASSGRAVNVAKWFSLYSFDVMGELAFGASFKVLESKGQHWAVKLWSEAFGMLAYILPAWFFRIVVSLPKVSGDWWKFLEYCNQKLYEKMNVRDTDATLLIQVSC